MRVEKESESEALNRVVGRVSASRGLWREWDQVI